jgi:hypothetical protein
MTTKNRPEIEGSSLVTDVFGYWPGFHDAEVCRLELKANDVFAAGPDLVAEIYAFEMTSEVSPSGHYVLRNQVLVTIKFRGVDNVEIGGFNNQNVLMGLTIEGARAWQLEDVKFDIAFDSSWGVGARFVCREVVVESVQPWDPERRCVIEQTVGSTNAAPLGSGSQ